MHDDDAPQRNLRERTGKHRCVQCMNEIPAEEYFRNDFFCDACTAAEQERADAERGQRDAR